MKEKINKVLTELINKPYRKDACLEKIMKIIELDKFCISRDENPYLLTGEELIKTEKARKLF